MRRMIPPRLALLAFAHFSIDAYSSFLTPLLPLLVARLHMSLGQVGALVALSALASSISQPLFGMIADRLTRPWFVAFGPLLAAILMSAVGLAPSYGALIAILMIGGLGAASFHPQAAVLAGNLGARRTMSLSVFVTSGTLGFSLGPLFAVSVVAAFGLSRTWLAALPGLVVASFLLAWFARVTPQPRHVGARPALSELRPFLRPLVLLYLTAAIRSAVGFGFMTFLPILLHQRGFSVQFGGACLTAYLAAGAVGGFAGGWAAGRRGGRWVMIRSFTFALPLFAGFVLLHGAWGLTSLVLANLMLQGALPLNVVMGQELSPRHASTVSSMLMGAAWGLGSMMVGPVGAIGDRAGLTPALLGLVALLVPGALCAWALPDIRRTDPGLRPAEVLAVAE